MCEREVGSGQQGQHDEEGKRSAADAKGRGTETLVSQGNREADRWESERVSAFEQLDLRRSRKRSVGAKGRAVPSTFLASLSPLPSLAAAWGRRRTTPSSNSTL